MESANQTMLESQVQQGDRTLHILRLMGFTCLIALSLYSFITVLYFPPAEQLVVPGCTEQLTCSTSGKIYLISRFSLLALGITTLCCWVAIYVRHRTYFHALKASELDLVALIVAHVAIIPPFFDFHLASLTWPFAAVSWVFVMIRVFWKPYSQALLTILLFSFWITILVVRPAYEELPFLDFTPKRTTSTEISGSGIQIYDSPSEQSEPVDTTSTPISSESTEAIGTMSITVNGSAAPSAVNDGSTFTFMWKTSGAEYCYALGDGVKTTDGTLWVGFKTKLASSGTVNLIASKTGAGTQADYWLDLGLQCYNTAGEIIAAKGIIIPVQAPR